MSSEECDELTPEDMYEFLKNECAELIEQYEKIKQENDQEFKEGLSTVFKQAEQQNESEEAAEYFKNAEMGTPLENLETKEDIEKYKDKLLEEKKILESQFIDVNIEIQRKKRQAEDFQTELDTTRRAISQMEQKISEKDKAIQILEEHIEKFKQF